jgi:hypothetical protein
MIQDRLEMFSNAQAVTGTADSTNVLDLGAHGDDLQRNLMLFVQVREPATAEGAATVKVGVYTGTAEGSQATLLHETAAIAKATLVAGYFMLKIPLPANVGRYLKLTYTVATGPLTAGTFDAGLIWGIDQTA